MGNPLLDISGFGSMSLDFDSLPTPGNAIIAEEKHQPLFAEMTAMKDVQYIAGGATQNSIRVAQWMLQEPGQTAFFGSVGDDANGKTLLEACQKDGVAAMYHVDKQEPTGCCATLICNVERSLCTNLCAANTYQAEHTKNPENWRILQEAKVIYSAGFFATVCPEALKLAYEQKARDGGIYCLNLAAPFICQVPPLKAVIDAAIPYTDYLFGNETEAAAYASAAGWETSDVKEIALRLAAIPKAKGKVRDRHVVITQGASPTIVACGGTVNTSPVKLIAKEKLVDTNGAGDSFVGGFLAGLIKGKGAEDCCKAGAHAASIIVQHNGCTFPPSPGYEW